MINKIITFAVGIVVIIVIMISILSTDGINSSESTSQSANVSKTTGSTDTSSLRSDTDEQSDLATASITVPKETLTDKQSQYQFYAVSSVVDGDTVKINVDGKVQTYRLIGMDTPETVDPRKEVQCFGVEASNKAKELLSGKKVRIETDPTQGVTDKYNRLLAYIHLENGLFFNKHMIEQGYAHEYTYDIPYKYQVEFKKAQKDAQENKAGLWSPDTCNGDTVSTKEPINVDKADTTPTPTSCNIKGNISSTKEKIYHMVGCGSYNKTVIDETKGEKMFCSEKEAIDAGWRKALNCN